MPSAIRHPGGTPWRDICRDNGDREASLDVLTQVIEPLRWTCHATCLMGDSRHLLAEIPEPMGSRAVRQLNEVYEQGFHRRYRIVGHLFGERFSTILVERETDLAELRRCLVLNRVSATVLRAGKGWLWSSDRPREGG